MQSPAAAAPPDPPRCEGDAARAAELAYRQGSYDVAIQAAEQALAAGSDAEPRLHFRLGEAYRQKYALSPTRALRDRALAAYREFLSTDPSGPERQAAEESAAWLASQPVDAAASEDVGSDGLASEDDATRILIASPNLGARARIDDEHWAALPVAKPIEAGAYRIVIAADGFERHVCTARVQSGRLTIVFAELDVAPARLAIDGPEGASLRIDGELIGVLPLERPLELEPGPHLVVVSKNGFEARSQRVVLERERLKKIAMDLDATDQRAVAWTLLFAGGAGIGAGVGFGIASVVNHREARDILQRNEELQLDDDDREEFAELNSRRDDFRIASGFSAALGLASFVIGGYLFAEDEPELVGGGVGGGASPRSKDDDDIETSILPIVGPDTLGSAIHIAF